MLQLYTEMLDTQRKREKERKKRVGVCISIREKGKECLFQRRVYFYFFDSLCYVALEIGLSAFESDLFLLLANANLAGYAERECIQCIHRWNSVMLLEVLSFSLTFCRLTVVRVSFEAPRLRLV